MGKCPLEPLVKKKYHIRGGYGIEFLERLPMYCTIATSYFPETINACDPYQHIFEMDYEDFIIDLFSELPTTCCFQRASTSLICHERTPKKPIERVTTRLEDIPGIQHPFLVEALVKRGIVRKENQTRKEYYWRKELD
ncbi:MAG: hypothetical protein HXS52_02545 [Theionarchaea archaeon]|nr:hypothetical protein [Theionarchaea archaeon]